VHWNTLTAFFLRLPISVSGRVIVILESACCVSRVISGTTCEQNLAHKFRGNGVTSDLSRDLSIFLSTLYPRLLGVLNVILLSKMSLSRSAAKSEKSEDATHADHVPRAEANLFSPAVTFDSLCHSRCAPSIRDLPFQLG